MQRLSKRFDKIIGNLKNKNIDFTQRNLVFFGGLIAILYIKELTQRDALSERVIKPLIQRSGESIKANTIENFIYADECKIESDEKKIEENILMV